MNASEGLIRVSFLALLLVTNGCTSMRTADPSAPESERRVEVGDTARIVTHDGQEFVIHVTAIEGDALVGVLEKKEGHAATGFEVGRPNAESDEERLRVPFDKVAMVQVRDFDGWRTTALVGSTVAGFWLLGVLLASMVVVAPM
jgi:hypothetical protein